MSMTITRRHFLGTAAALGCAVAYQARQAAALPHNGTLRLAGLYYVQVELAPCSVSEVLTKRREVERLMGLETALEEQWIGAPEQATEQLGMLAHPCGTRMTLSVSSRFKHAGARVVARGQDDTIEFTCG